MLWLKSPLLLYVLGVTIRLLAILCIVKVWKEWEEWKLIIQISIYAGSTLVSYSIFENQQICYIQRFFKKILKEIFQIKISCYENRYPS